MEQRSNYNRAQPPKRLREENLEQGSPKKRVAEDNKTQKGQEILPTDKQKMDTINRPENDSPIQQTILTKPHQVQQSESQVEEIQQNNYIQQTHCTLSQDTTQQINIQQDNACIQEQRDNACIIEHHDNACTQELQNNTHKFDTQEKQQEQEEDVDDVQYVDNVRNEDVSEEEEEDQVCIALKRLIPHLGNSQKFRKASKLVRQLLDSGKVQIRHAKYLFQGLQSSMECRENSNDPQLNLEYRKLFMIASQHKNLFSSEQRAYLQAYGIWAVYRTDLSTTDDSFKFNKTIGDLKDLVSDLPVVKQEEDQRSKESDSLQIQREALLDCAEAARLKLKIPWAKSSVEIFIQHIHQNRNRFCESDQSKIEELWKFMRTNQVHGSTVSYKRERTTFEDAQDRYAGSKISHRGKVGAQGDRKAENWLG